MKFCIYLLVIYSSTLLAEIGMLKSIVDGNTLRFNNTTCRIAYIDTPESQRNAKAKRDIQSCPGISVETLVGMGKESTKHAESILQIGKSYRYEVIATDHYKRSICIVDLGKTTFNEQMIIDGYAVVYERYVPKNLKRRYLLLEKEAKRTNQGLWYKHQKICAGQ